MMRAGECLPLFLLLFWLLPPEAGPAECPGRCFLICGLLKNETEERHKHYYCDGSESRGGMPSVCLCFMA